MGNMSKQERKGNLQPRIERVCFSAGMAKELTAKPGKDPQLVDIDLLNQTNF